MHIYVKIKISYIIKGYENYAFGENKLLYNLHTNRQIKQVYKNGCLGYNLNGKFKSLLSIKELLIKPKRVNVPF